MSCHYSRWFLRYCQPLLRILLFTSKANLCLYWTSDCSCQIHTHTWTIGPQAFALKIHKPIYQRVENCFNVQTKGRPQCSQVFTDLMYGNYQQERKPLQSMLFLATTSLWSASVPSLIIPDALLPSLHHISTYLSSPRADTYHHT